MHHPFTSPVNDDPAALEADPAGALARAYDMVLNGSEIGGGSVRIHRNEMQSTVFELLGIGAEEAQRKFGFLLEALKYGAPPHGGIAFGLDRLVMLMAGAESHPRRDRLPEDPDRELPAHRRADRGVASSSCATAHPRQDAGQGVMSGERRRPGPRPVDERVEFGMLEHRLRHEHGFEIRTFSYPSMHGDVGARSAADLAEFCVERRAATRRVHFVGHSLGGAIVYRTLAEHGAGRNVGNAVLLGSPLERQRGGARRRPAGRCCGPCSGRTCRRNWPSLAAAAGAALARSA